MRDFFKEYFGRVMSNKDTEEDILNDSEKVIIKMTKK